jgi:hypothetical protein
VRGFGFLENVMKTIYKLMLAAMFLVAVAPVRSQQREVVSPTLALARLCVSEAGWECFDRGDGYAIHEVLLRGAARQQVRYTSFARSYAQRLFGARPHDSARLAWVSQLNTQGTAPSSWPRYAGSRTVDGVVVLTPHAPWSSFRARWQAVLARAEEVVAQQHLETVEEWSICEAQVHDWGGWMDRDRAARLGLIEVDCGDTRNDFYARPSLLGNDIEIDQD